MSGGDAQTQLQGHFLPSAKPAHDLSKKRICLRPASAPSKPRARLLLHRESIGPQKRNHPESCIWVWCLAQGCEAGGAAFVFALMAFLVMNDVEFTAFGTGVAVQVVFGFGLWKGTAF